MPWRLLKKERIPRMRIEIHHSYFSPVLGGQERRIHAIFRELLHRGHEVTIVAPRDGVDEACRHDTTGLRILTHAPFSTPKLICLFDPIVNVRRLRRYHQLRSARPAPDLILAFSHLYALAARLAFPSVRIVYLAGAAAWDWHLSLYGQRPPFSRACLTIRRLAALAGEKRALNAVDQVFVESEFLRNRLTHFHSKIAEKITILPASVDTKRFCPDPLRNAAIRRELNVSNDTRVVLGVGRFDPNKNYAVLLDALASARSRAVLVLVGAGTQEAALRQKAAELGIGERVKFLGLRNDVERIYQAADIYAHPSLLESHSNAILEAMASGLPCMISADVARDLTAGRDALLVDPRNSGGWARAIDTLTGDPALAARLGAAARSHCEHRPDWPTLITSILAVSPPRAAAAPL
jgi:glycosyltransferase involved in cell wall biosynthesis